MACIAWIMCRLGQPRVLAEFPQGIFSHFNRGVTFTGRCLVLVAVNVQPEGTRAGGIGRCPTVRGHIFGTGEVDLFALAG